MNNKPKLTPEFPGRIKPVYEGVYQTEHGYQFYDTATRKWYGYASTPEGAVKEVPYVSMYQSPRWRGILKGA